jgi:hypothetical protein
MENIYKKLFDLQSKVGKISKDMDNPFFKSKYFDINKLIEHVQPLLQAHSLVLTQPIESWHVVSRITCVESLEAISSSLEIPSGIDPQKMGSAVTYLRRYTLQSLLALQAEDDDGNTASGKASGVKPEIKPGTDRWAKAAHSLASGEIKLDFIKSRYRINPEHLKQLDLESKQLQS